MNSKILIVEDKSILAQDIADRLERFGYKQVIGPFSSGEEALEAVKTEMPDLALLDISLKGKMNGIQLAQKLNDKNSIPIVYLTSHEDDETFDASLNTYPVAYINKPFTNNELKMAVFNGLKLRAGDKLSQGLNASQDQLKVLDDRIFVRNGRGKFSIMLDDILYIQSGGGETSTIVSNLDISYQPKVGYTLNKLEEKLSFYPKLVRCSRYHIINLSKVERILDSSPSNKSISKKELLVKGELIPVGAKYRKDIMSKLHIF
ncbi:MAG: response regulator [Bacteroidota bacterium]